MVTILEVTSFIGAIFTVYVSFVYFITIFSKRGKLFKTYSLPKKLPKVSIIVPAFNEQKTIAQTLKSLLNLDYPKNKLDIIAVNDGSTDNTEKIMRSFKSKIKILSQKRQGKAAALNNAMKISTGDIIATTDADSTVNREALSETIGYFNDPKIAAVTTSVKVAKQKNFIQKIQFIEYIFNILYRKVFSIMDSIFVIPGPFGLYRKSTLTKLGGFEKDNLTEDMEIAMRIQKHGYRIENSLKAVSFTNAPSTIKNLFKQRVRWYRGFIINVRRYKKFLLNSKSGNLGVFTLPTNIAFVGLMFLFIIGLVYSLFNDLIIQSQITYLVGYIPFSFEFKNPIFFWNIFTVLLTFSTVFLILNGIISFKLGREKFRFYMIPVFAVGIFFYVFLIAATWAESIKQELKRERFKWER